MFLLFVLTFHEIATALLGCVTQGGRLMLKVDGYSLKIKLVQNLIECEESCFITRRRDLRTEHIKYPITNYDINSTGNFVVLLFYLFIVI